ncbi:LysR family transcriptional regulator [Gallaecimonas kandeliae]|uniref:LysR family transcriptional regulator n=1 Tax=Gallaecimonas kandeliae TaxID=3029055 RepID=UPI0026480716|nr:LysR family transcriptional regulator [Gallaecimonas kandeliae]WKE65627.1 LysR family transcriptional regulator [Gallaecimonas kandeliae]
MDTLHAMRLFARAVELGSFSAVAREEKVGQPTVSKVIAALEQELGVRLLERSTTSLALTEAGRRFYARSGQLLEEYADAVADARGQRQQLAGTLRLAAPVGLGELRLNALVLAFLAAYPEIEIELILNDRVVDLVEEGVDLAIRLGGELPPDVIARHIADSPRLLVATSNYVEGSPRIARPEDLAGHEYYRFAWLATGSSLAFSRGGEKVVVETQGRYRVNSSLALRQCFLEGKGLGSAPAWLVQDLVDSGELVQLLPDWTLPPQPLHLVYPSRKYQPHRTQALLRFLAERIPALPGFLVQGT